jgi:hypothetical protein
VAAADADVHPGVALGSEPGTAVERWPLVAFVPAAALIAALPAVDGTGFPTQAVFGLLDRLVPRRVQGVAVGGGDEGLHGGAGAEGIDEFAGQDRPGIGNIEKALDLRRRQIVGRGVCPAAESTALFTREREASMTDSTGGTLILLMGAPRVASRERERAMTRPRAIGATKEMATPLRPARPVRPMRCT